MLGTKRLPSCLSGETPEGFEPEKRPATEGTDCVKTGATRETDTVKIQSRLKQIQFGKNTTGYDNYVAAVPKRKRSMPIDKHPRTPDPYEIQSKRQFDGKIRVWRRGLHLWDNHGDAAFSSSSSVPLGSLDAIVNQSKKRLELTSKPPSLPCTTRHEINTVSAANFQQYDGESIVGVSFDPSNLQITRDPNPKVCGNGGNENDIAIHMDVTTMSSTTAPETCDIFNDGHIVGKEMYSSSMMNVPGDADAAVEVLRMVDNDHHDDGLGDNNDDDDDDVL